MQTLGLLRALRRNRTPLLEPSFEPSFEPSVTDEQLLQLREAVERLDQVCPDWRNRVNVNQLNMRSIFNCVLGQVFDNYDYGIKKLYGSFEGATNAYSANAFYPDFPVEPWIEAITQ